MSSHSSWASALVIIGTPGQVCGRDHGWVDPAQPPCMKRRPFAGVCQQRAQPLGLVVFDLFPRPVEAPDVILERALHGIDVGGAKPLI